MIDELELRIQVTEAQIKQAQKELRKTEDEITSLEGQRIAFVTILDLMKAKGNKQVQQ